MLESSSSKVTTAGWEGVLTTTGVTMMAQPYDQTKFYIGLVLAVSSSLFIGASFIIKKKALIQLNRAGSLRAASGGFGYLKEWMWWMGFLFMGLGEVANFTAYAFAPASLVTPLGALSVLVTAVLSSKYLKERLNLIGKLGCFLCLLGSTIIVIHSPKEEEVESLAELLEKLVHPLFVLYVSIVILITVLISFYYGPKYGNQSVIVYIILCSAVGSLTVMSCKGLGLAIRETFSGKNNDFNSWLTYAFVVTVIICICIQMDYLNKALDLFNTSIVTPIYYVLFTTFVIIASTILFREWGHLQGADVVGNICGFFVIIIAIVLLHGFKDLDISVNDMRGLLRPKHEPLLRSIYLERADYGSGNHSFIRSI